MRYLIAYLFALFCALPVTSQECSLSLRGQVVDFHDQTPLSGALVEVTAKNLYAQTDPDGFFELSGLCPNVYEIQVSHPECRTVFRVVDLEEDASIRITLEHHIQELEEVMVLGESNPNEVRSLAESVIEKDVLEQFSHASLGDALKNISGVSSINTGAAIVKPVIQGLYGSRVLILNKGVRQQDMEWGEEHAPNVDLNSADKVRLIKGASALKYGGDAIGGIIVLEGNRIIPRDSLWGSTLLSGSSNGQGGNITSELTRSWASGFYASLQGSFRRMGDLRAPDYVLSNTGNQQIGLSLELGKQGFEQGWNVYYSFYDTQIAILRASHIGNVDDLIRSINNQTPEVVFPFTYQLNEPRQEVTHHLAKASYYKRFEGLGKWEVQYDFQRNQRFEFDVNRTQSDAGRPSIDLVLTTHSATSSLRIDRFSDLELEFGILGRYQDNFADPATGVRRLIPDYERFEGGVFAAMEWELSGDWTADAGARFDYSRIDARKFYRTSRWVERGYDTEFSDLVIEDLGTQLLTNPVLDFGNVSTTAGLTFSPARQWKWSVNLSMAQRAPNPSELFSDGLHHSAARIELGDLRIGKETAYKASINALYRKDGLTVEATPFINRISNFILLEPSGVEFTIRGAFPVWTYRQADALLRGLDLRVSRQWMASLSSEHQFSLVKGTDLDRDEALINMPPVNMRNAVAWSRPEWNQFTFGVESRYVFRQNEFPENIEVFSPEQNEDVLLEINTPPPAYHLVNLNASMAFENVVGGDLEVSLLVQNLFNTRYRDYLDRLRYFADNPGQNWILNLRFNY